LNRLAPALCINYLNVIHLKGTVFGKTIGVMDPIPLIGKQFQSIFPATLLLLCIFNFFNLWSKLMVFLGLDEYSFSEIFDEETASDGEVLSKIERVAREERIMEWLREEESLGAKRKYGYLYEAQFFIDNPG